MQPMIKDEIEQLIDSAKSLPNSENKNRMISHLKDAHAHAVVLEMHTVPKSDPNVCTCPAPGARSKSCTAPVHI